MDNSSAEASGMPTSGMAEGAPMGFQDASLTDLPAFKLGNYTDNQAATGTTVIIAPAGVIGACDVRGGGPATRETDLLRPEMAAQEVHAIMLSGGSAFGLAAADGVMRELEARGIGLKFAGMCVPIVPSACIFDLMVGKSDVRPDATFGAAAVAAAFDEGGFSEGNVGAGAGASVGKLLGPERSMKSGLGLCVLRCGNAVLGAVVAVNACGSVVDTNGITVAGASDGNGGVIDADVACALAASALAGTVPGAVNVSTRSNASGMPQQAGARDSDSSADVRAHANTTIGCVFTNIALAKAQAAKVAAMTHDAFARAITPVHTPNDGDTVFCLSSGEVQVGDPVDLAGIMACEAMRQAILRSVRAAKGAYGLPCASDLAAGN